MKLDFNSIKEDSIKNFKGGEKDFNAKFFTDDLNKILMGRLIPGASIGMHSHDTSSEIMYFTSGEGHVLFKGESIPLKAGDVHYCPKGCSHSLINDGKTDLCFFAVVPEQ